MENRSIERGIGVPIDQLTPGRFPDNYDTQRRWMSYWYQIHEVLETGCKDLLEIGPGNKTVSDYLRRRGIRVTTFDLDPRVKPDHIGSVKELTAIFEPDSFDTVLCAEVLEHIPFADCDRALDEIYSVCRNYAIISLPYSPVRASVSVEFRIPKIGIRRFQFGRTLPFARKRIPANIGHFWEIGRRGYPMKRILITMTRRFNLVKSFVLPENVYHAFFVLKKSESCSPYKEDLWR